jgi:Putative Zn-dependent protease, contains TPR repeats
MKHSPRLLLAVLALLAAPALIAQDAPQIQFPSASPPATLKQRVGLTDVEITYSRPSVKGRKIFGELLPYGEIWRTGANQATQITFSTPVKLNGTALDAGTYELFSIPSADEWTVIIHKPMSQWGAYAYDAKNDITRLKVKPVNLPNPIETFTFQIGDLRDESATIYFAWERVRVPLKLEVEVKSVVLPQIEKVMASNTPKKPYFPAAMFYFEHNIDLPKALEWIDAALAADPNAFYVAYHKARLLAKMGDKEAAKAAANQSKEIANKLGGAVAKEYAHLNDTLLATLN